MTCIAASLFFLFNVSRQEPGVVFTSPWAYPLRVSPNGRYLVDQTGQPFFWSGDAAWSLLTQVTREDAEYYLENRRQKGVTVVLANLLEHQFAAYAPSNIYGDPPFTGAPFTTPNEAYFAHVDYVLTAAAQRGILVLLAPLYLGYNCGAEGWCQEVQAAPLEAMRFWGRYLGNRYKDFGNLIWLIGADADPTPVQEKLREFVSGIREYDTRLMTAMNQPESYAVTPWPGESWLTLNNFYTYSLTLYQQSQTAYALSPVLPYFLIESTYENEHNSTPQQLRAQAYWALLSGAFGHIFGNCPVWNFGFLASWCNPPVADWKTELDNAGSLSMLYAQRLFTSRAWQLLVPDVAHTVLTAGYGTYGATDYATAARTADGTTILAYLPTSRPVTVDLSTVSGTQAKAWWYDPSTGLATLIGTFSTAGATAFTPPSDGDWVLVIDDASKNLPAPGTSPPPTTLTLTKAGPGTGSITSAPAGIDCGATCRASYDYGTLVTLSSSPATGAILPPEWRGTCAGTAPAVLRG